MKLIKKSQKSPPEINPEGPWEESNKKEKQSHETHQTELFFNSLQLC